jgi:nucleotide-binding universal stress UspA family protein
VTEPPPQGWADLVIDALLGLGARRPLDADMAAAVRAINEQACPRLSIDLPTGLDADTGQALGGGWVRAQATLSLLTLKPGLFMGIGRDAAGRIWFDPLDGRPLASPIDPVALTVAAPERSSGQQHPRPHASHKGRFGDVIVLGGAEGMTGALRLAAHAALAAGAGRVIGVTEAMLAGPVPAWVKQRMRDPDTAAIAAAWQHEHDDEVAALGGTLKTFQGTLPSAFRSHEPIVAQGNPGEKILEQVKADGTDLVVLGRTPTDALSRWLLGSTSEAVLTHGSSSVLLVPVEKR